MIISKRKFEILLKEDVLFYCADVSRLDALNWTCEPIGQFIHFFTCDLDQQSF